MKNTVKLSEVLELAKSTGHLGWFKIAIPKGTLQISTTIFMQNFVQKDLNDEIVMFGKKQLNITKMQNHLSKYIGRQVNFFVGDKSFNGKLELC